MNSVKFPEIINKDKEKRNKVKKTKNKTNILYSSF